MDSDDYWEPNMLGYLMQTMEERQLDVLRFNYQNVRLITSEGMNELTNERYEVFEPFKNIKPYFDYSNEIEDGETFLNKRLGYACYAAQFIIKRELLNNCLFKEGIYYEDTDWTPRMLLKAKRVSSTEKIVYNYLWREGSITLPKDPAKKKKIFEDRRSLLNGFLEQQKYVTDRSWFEWHIASITLSLLEYISAYPLKERRSYIKELRALDIFPITTYRAVGNNKWKIRLVNLSPYLYCKMVKILHK